MEKDREFSHSFYPSIYPSIYLSVYLSIYLSFYLRTHIPGTYPTICAQSFIEAFITSNNWHVKWDLVGKSRRGPLPDGNLRSGRLEAFDPLVVGKFP